MTGSLAVLLVIFGIIALMAIHAEIDWRYRQRRKAISDTKGQS